MKLVFVTTTKEGGKPLLKKSLKSCMGEEVMRNLPPSPIQVLLPSQQQWRNSPLTPKKKRKKERKPCRFLPPPPPPPSFPPSLKATQKTSRRCGRRRSKKTESEVFFSPPLLWLSIAIPDYIFSFLKKKSRREQEEEIWSCSNQKSFNGTPSPPAHLSFSAFLRQGKVFPFRMHFAICSKKRKKREEERKPLLQSWKGGGGNKKEEL